jgi:mRNA-degrading endonuclease toxin of MazEF toxin-antitoxin module
MTIRKELLTKRIALLRNEKMAEIQKAVKFALDL